MEVWWCIMVTGTDVCILPIVSPSICLFLSPSLSSIVCCDFILRQPLYVWQWWYFVVDSGLYCPSDLDYLIEGIPLPYNIIIYFLQHASDWLSLSHLYSSMLNFMMEIVVKVGVWSIVSGCKGEIISPID